MKKEYDKALGDFNKAILINPRDTYSYNCRGDVYFELGLHNDAVSDFQKALDLDEKSVGAYVGMAIAYLRQGKQKDAKKYYNKALVTFNHHHPHLHHRALFVLLFFPSPH